MYSAYDINFSNAANSIYNIHVIWMKNNTYFFMVEYLIENLARADIETTTSQDNYMISASFVLRLAPDHHNGDFV